MGIKFTPELHIKGEYLKFFRKLRSSTVEATGNLEYFNEIEGDIGEMLYSAQVEGKSLKTIIGENENEYIGELIITFFESTPNKKIMKSEIGNCLIYAGLFAVDGLIFFNSIIAALILSIIGAGLRYVSIMKLKSEGNAKVIKYLNIYRALLYIPLYIPLFLVLLNQSAIDRYEIKLLIPYYIISLIVTIIGSCLIVSKRDK